MKILGIESSCDETAIGIVDENKNILSNVVVSQIDIHKEFGGVVPEIASRNHLDVIEKISHEHNYAIFAFCITDVINSNTYILYNEDSRNVFETIFNLKEIYQGYKLKGVVSRKKQIIPLLMEELNK